MFEDERKSQPATMELESAASSVPERPSFQIEWNQPDTEQLQALDAPKYSHQLPPGFRKLQTGTMAFGETFLLIRKVNEMAQSQLQHYWLTGSPDRNKDRAWTELASLSYEQGLLLHGDLMENWLCWGMLAYIYQCYSSNYQCTVALQLFERLDQLVQHAYSKRKPKPKKLLSVLDENLRLTYRRNCAVWVLMCVATTYASRRQDILAPPSGLDVSNGRASEALMNRIRGLLGFDKTGVKNADIQWDSVKAVVMQFWCPPWMMKDWEVIWKASNADSMGNAVTNPVYQRWHNAIVHDDVYG